MKSHLAQLDRWLARSISVFGGVAMVLLTAIVFLQVFARYVLNLPIGAVEELPIYLMMLAIWTTAAVNVKRKDHISIDVINLFVKNQRTQKAIDSAVEFATAVVLVLFFRLIYRYFLFNLKSGNTTAGLEIPIWALLFAVLVCVGLMALYSLINAAKAAKEVAAWK